MERFRIHVADEVLDDLRVRLRRTRWPDQVPGIGWKQGTELDCSCEIPLCAISRVLKTSGGARLRFICKDFRVTEFGIATVNSALACR